MLVAAGAATHTLRAAHIITSRATDVAAVAHRGLALLAVPAIISGHQGTAVAALDTVPIFQRHIWAAGVVGPQQVGDDHEEVEQTALGQRLRDRPATIALTDGFVLHMRMRHALVGGRRMRGGSDHAVIVSMVCSRSIQFQPNLEGSQIDALEFNRLGRYGNRPLATIHRDLIEFLLQGFQVGMNIPH